MRLLFLFSFMLLAGSAHTQEKAFPGTWKVTSSWLKSDSSIRWEAATDSVYLPETIRQQIKHVADSMNQPVEIAQGYLRSLVTPHIKVYRFSDSGTYRYSFMGSEERDGFYEADKPTHTLHLRFVISYMQDELTTKYQSVKRAYTYTFSDAARTLRLEDKDSVLLLKKE